MQEAVSGSAFLPWPLLPLFLVPAAEGHPILASAFRDRSRLLGSFDIQPVLDGFFVPVRKAPAVPLSSMVSQYAKEHCQGDHAADYG
jgi:hypothetical protein